MRGVLLDVGGVFLLPSRMPLVRALGFAVSHLPDGDFDRAHFDGMHALDRADASRSDEWHAYLGAYLSSLGFAQDQLTGAIALLVPLWTGPSPDLWQRVLNLSMVGLRKLYDAGLKLGIVSNSDGRVEDELRRGRICQVGSGHGVPVLTVVDSAVVGVSKPDPTIFDFALPTLGLHPSEVVYIGDSVKYDVRSAEAAGMTPLHFDPFSVCDGMDHSHVARIEDVLDYV